MRLKLTLVRADGSEADLVVEADDAMTLSELALALCLRDPKRGSDGDQVEPVSLRQWVPLGDHAEGAWSNLPGGLAVGTGALASGTRVALATTRPGTSAAESGSAVIEIASGEALGTTRVIGPGTWTIGRDASCDIVLADRHVSARHARIEVSDRISVVDLGSANGIEVDGEVVRRVAVHGSRVIVFGETRVRISARIGVASDPARPAHRGQLAFTPAPRVETRYAAWALEAPSIPPEAATGRHSWVALVSPLAFGIGLAIMTGRLIMLWFAALSPVLLVGALLVARLRRRSVRRRSRAAFESRLSDLGAQFDRAIEAELAARCGEVPSGRDVIADAASAGPLLWTRRPEHWNFLTVRLGIGALPARTTVATPAGNGADAALDAQLGAFVAQRRLLRNAPLAESFVDAGALGWAGRDEHLAPVVNGVLAQLIGLHSPAELVVVVLANPGWAAGLDWLKWAPHTSSPASPLGALPHLSDSQASSDLLITALETLIDERLARANGILRGPGRMEESALNRGARVGESAGHAPLLAAALPTPAIVVVVNAGAEADQARLVRLTERGPDAGVFPIWTAPDLAGLPAACRTICEVNAPEAGSVSFVRLGTRVSPVEFEAVAHESADHFGRSLASVTHSSCALDRASDLPSSVGLAEVIDPRAFESPSVVIGRWLENDSIRNQLHTLPAARLRAGRLRAYVGMGRSGPIALDLREQGPHALVGGTTGAGKSEFLQTWVLGIASEFSPDRVAFLFVDYKGGSAFRECVSLPHCVGLVTDLDSHLAERVLISLRAELRRREDLLRHKAAKDLLELERRRDPDTPPALVLVIDEFAALVRDVPQFVDGVVDIAQRGRSLGIHLILATQRPAGVITDNLRANATLRVALRTADPSDSRDVLGVPDAALFHPAAVGRAISTTGAGRFETFQAAYAGGYGVPSGAPEATITPLGFASASRGESWAGVAPAGRTARADALTHQQQLVESIATAARLTAIAAPRRPWLDELPRLVTLADLAKHRSDGVPIGISDDPANQRRTVAAFTPDVDGHIAFYGASGSGKSSALRTLAVASANTGEPLRVYGLDFGSGSLRSLETLAQVGSIIVGSDVERIERMLRMLRDTMLDRIDRYSSASATTIADYRRIASADREPRILVLIDGFATFREGWEHVVGRSSWYDVIGDVLTLGRSIGVHLALTVDRPGAFPSSVSALIGRRVVARLADAGGYGALGVPKDVLDEHTPPGRCVLDGLETQLAVAEAFPNLEHGPHAPELIEPAPPIGRLTTHIVSTELPSAVVDRPVLGISDETLAPFGFEPHGSFLIAGPPGSGRSNAIAWIAQSLIRHDPEIELVRFCGINSRLGSCAASGRLASGVDSAVSLAGEMADVLSAAPARRFAILIESIADLLGTPAESALAGLVAIARRQGRVIVAESETTGWSGSWPLLTLFKAGRRGLLLQPDQSDGELLLRTALPRFGAGEVPPGRGVYVARGRSTRVQIPLTAGDPNGVPTGGPAPLPRVRSPQ